MSWIYAQPKADAIESLLSLTREPIFEGLLSEQERATLPELIENGTLKRVYVGAAGFMGLATITRKAEA